jgi:hypothetical protein
MSEGREVVGFLMRERVDLDSKTFGGSIKRFPL